MKKEFYMLIPLFVSLVSCGPTDSTEKTIHADTIPVKVMALEQKPVALSIPVSGRFTTDDETMLSFKTGGIIRRILVEEGARVSAGQVLATLDLTEMNALVKQASLAEEKARRDYERAERLFRDSVATREMFENARTAWDLATEQLKTAKFNDQYSVIRATGDGYVLMKLAAEGQLVGPGTPVLQVNSAANGKWLLKAGISDRDRALISAGDKAVLYTDVHPDRRISATVIRRSESIDPMSGTFTLVLEVDGRVPELAAGMFGKGEVFPSGNTDVWEIPYEAVLDGNGQEGYVFVTGNNGIAEKRSIKIHTLTPGKVLVSSGLEKAGLLIISGSAYLNDQSPVRIIR